MFYTQIFYSNSVLVGIIVMSGVVEQTGSRDRSLGAVCPIMHTHRVYCNSS